MHVAQENDKADRDVGESGGIMRTWAISIGIGKYEVPWSDSSIIVLSHYNDEFERKRLHNGIM